MVPMEGGKEVYRERTPMAPLRCPSFAKFGPGGSFYVRPLEVTSRSCIAEKKSMRKSYRIYVLTIHHLTRSACISVRSPGRPGQVFIRKEMRGKRSGIGISVARPAGQPPAPVRSLRRFDPTAKEEVLSIRRLRHRAPFRHDRPPFRHVIFLPCFSCQTWFSNISKASRLIS